MGFQALEKKMIEWRRDFHAYPEIGWGEFLTTAKLIKLLDDMGYELLVGKAIINEAFVRGRNSKVVEQSFEKAVANGANKEILDRLEKYTGCVAILDTGKPGPTTILRFDIDCVNVQETAAPEHVPNQLGFRSKNDGLMHSCGHDGHMAVGLGLAEWIMQNKEKLNGKIKIIFQPAEEGVRGAAAVVHSGLVDDGDYFISMHLGIRIKSGEVLLSPTHFLCTTKIDIRFKGKPAHAGIAPQEGHNALLAAAHATTQLFGISRHGGGMTRINVGVLKAGEGRNVIPCNAELQLEVRGENSEINQYMVDEVMRITQGVATSYNLEFETEITGEACDLSNDAELVDMLREAAKQDGLFEKILETRSFNGSEDATLLAKRVQEKGGKSLYFVLGSDMPGGHHEANFDLDEKQFLPGLMLFTRMIEKLNSPQ